MTDTLARQRQLIGTAAEWAADDLILGAGELALERQLDGSVRARVGNGAAPFSGSPYLVGTVPALTYRGNIDPASAPPAGTVPGDMFTASPAGVVGAGWGEPAAGEAVEEGDWLALADDGAWHVIPGGAEFATFVPRAELADPALGAAMIGTVWPGAGAVERTQEARNRDTPSPYDFDISEAHDSTTGFRQWLAACQAEHIAPHSARKLRVPISDTVEMGVPSNGADFTGLFLSNITLLYSGPRNRPAFKINGAGPSGSGLTDQAPELWLPRVEALGAASWPGTLQGDDCGIFLQYIFHARIFAPYVTMFTKGLELCNCSYNSVFVGHLRDNKFAEVLSTRGPLTRIIDIGDIDLEDELSAMRRLYVSHPSEFGAEPVPLSVFAFTNENTFFGGRRGSSSLTNGLGDAYGTVLTWDGVSSYRGQNANRWYSPCYELGQPAGATYRTPLWLAGCGAFNRVADARVESCKGANAIFDGGGANYAYFNEFGVLFNETTGPQINALLQVNGAAGNLYGGLRAGNQRWHSGDLRGLLSSNGGADAPYIRGPVFVQDTTASVPGRTLAITGRVATNTKALQLAGAACLVALDTTRTKTFRLTSAALPGFAGRPVFIAFDAAGNRLTGNAPDATFGAEPYVKAGGFAITQGAGYGGCYQYGNADGSQDALITVRAEVAKLYAGFSYGTKALALQAFEVIGFANPETPADTSATGSLRVFADVADDGAQRLATAKPDTAGTHGYYQRGQKVFNANVAAGVTDGWPCSGSGYLARAWVAATAYEVPGHVVTNDGGKMYALVTGGVSAASGGPTGMGAGIVDGTCVWDYVGTKATFVTSAVTT